ncbi:HpcH/HpaI aldolase family protein [Corynebacterium sp. H130]|uniref:HpcH/HpaI aldolase family protein n=1 Tax=Corynebacterium sp. H130 TaxID=3133444 RepID=UPI00309B70B8
MPIQLGLPFGSSLGGEPKVGLWVCSGSPAAAEIMAGSGADWLLIDGEHSPIGLESISSLLRAVQGYDVAPVVRVPVNDTALIKQYLDLGVQNLMVPMVDSAEEAEAAVKAMHYPPRGVRGVGSALARSSRWNRVPGYLANASETVTCIVQIESVAAVAAVEEIVAVDGVDAIFIGPADLAASMGYLGQQSHPEVLDGVHKSIAAAKAAGKLVGVNAFDETQARAYLDAGVDFIAVGADVQLLVKSSDALVERFKK